MLCCMNCFNHQEVKGFIKRTGTIANCTYCRSENVKCIDAFKLHSIFNDLLRSYSKNYEEYNKIFIKEPVVTAEYESLVSLIKIEWDIFNKAILDDDTVAELIEEISFTNERNYISSQEALARIWVKVSEKYLGYFNLKIWNNFCDYIKHRFRYFNDLGNGSEFDPNELINSKTFKYSWARYVKSTILYRAREGYHYDKKSNLRRAFSPKEMKIPPKNIITSQRANPPGINYLSPEPFT